MYLPRSQPVRVASEKCLLTIDFLLLQAVSPLRLIFSQANLSDQKQSLKAFSSISAAAYRRQRKRHSFAIDCVHAKKKKESERSNLVRGYEPCWKRVALCRRSLWSCHLSNFTDYLRIAANWELQCEFANSAWRSPPAPPHKPDSTVWFNGTETHRPPEVHTNNGLVFLWISRFTLCVTQRYMDTDSTAVWNRIQKYFSTLFN